MTNSPHLLRAIAAALLDCRTRPLRPIGIAARCATTTGELKPVFANLISAGWITGPPTTTPVFTLRRYHLTRNGIDGLSTLAAETSDVPHDPHRRITDPSCRCSPEKLAAEPDAAAADEATGCGTFDHPYRPHSM